MENRLEDTANDKYTQIVSKILFEFKMKVKYKGYRRLRDAIVFACEDGTLIDNLKKELYVMVAGTNGTSTSIGNAISNAIQKAWTEVPQEVAIKYFGYYDPNDCPTNKQFIATIVEHIQVNLKAPDNNS